MVRFLTSLLLIALLAPRAAALVSIEPELARELQRRGVYDSVMRQLQEARARGYFSSGDARPASGDAGKAITSWRALVILVDFPDFPATGSYNQAQFDQLLFSEGVHATGSMREFYLENSYGDFSLTGDVVGWYTMPQNYSYYCNFDGVPSGDDFGFGDYPHNSQKLFEDAVDAADPDVNFLLYKNGASSVDGVFVVHAGPGAEATSNPNHIWSHRASFTVNTNDGVNCVGYTMEPETLYGGMSTMGVFAHEFGHTLGLPDLYDTDYSSSGIGRWSLMAGGSWNANGTRPAHYDAWCKAQLGFTVVTNVTTAATGVVVPPAYANEFALKIKTPAHAVNEYILIENRNRNGFDAALPASGLLVWHVDGSQQTNSYESCGANPSHPIVRLIQADDLCDLENNSDSGDFGDPFPGSTNNTTLGALSSPNSRAYSGKSSGVRLDNIALVGSDVVLDVDPGEALVLQVPTQFASLEDALGLAGFNDEVRLRSDYVVLGDNVLGSPTRISGGWDASYASQNPATKTLIQGTGALQPLLRIVTSGTPVLDNLRFVGGGGQEVFDPVHAWEGGAIRMQSGTLEISRCEFEGNFAGFNDGLASQGGALSLVDVDATISNSTFTNNHAKSAADLYARGGTLSIVDCAFQGGTLHVPGVFTEQQGGSIRVVGGQDLSIENSQFGVYSGADRGGTIYVEGANLTLNGVQLAGSDAELQGGGIYLENGSLSWSDSDLGPCNSLSEGGGIYAKLSSIQIDGGSVEGNSSASIGGGLYLLDSLAGSRVRSLLLRANQSSIIGGGMVVNGGEMLVEHCVFHANVATLGSAGAMQVSNANMVFRHNILHDSVGGGVLWSGGGTHEFNGYWGTSPGVHLSGIAMDLNSLTKDPLFVDDANGDFHLGVGSPMIDAGSGVATLDFDGSAPDMGLYGGALDDGDRPAAPANFATQRVGQDTELSWDYPGAGTAVSYTRVFGDYLTSLPKAGLGNATMLADVPAPTTTWTDTEFHGVFQVQLVDADGRAGAYSELLPEIPDPAPEAPMHFAVAEAAPNPFNPSTAIELRLPAASELSATVFDLRGRRVRVLATGRREAGVHVLRWDGRDASGATAASGLYLLRVESEFGSATRHLMLLK